MRREVPRNMSAIRALLSVLFRSLAARAMYGRTKLKRFRCCFLLPMEMKRQTDSAVRERNKMK